MARITLIHALRHSPPPVEAAFARLWPGQVLMNLLDDSLSADLAREGRLTPAMTERFRTLGRYAAGTGSDAILFTCSAFGPCIEAVAADLAPMPVLKPNEAMLAEIAAAGHRRVALVASFPGTLTSMPPEFPPGIEVLPVLAEGALAALDAGDVAAHDRLVAEAAAGAGGVDAIALGQFSLAHVGPRIATATGLPVFTTPESAVRRLKAMLGG
ncbi:MAG: arylsulfatase [Rubritepida sp.]|nr:arylsulfatase [Rubritepida sp.]